MGKSYVAVTLTAVTFLSSATTSLADSNSSFYQSVSPGEFVDYLALNVTGARTFGYLESVTVSRSAPDGETREQTFVSSGNAKVVILGGRIATRTADGYDLTYPTSTGKVRIQRFVRSTIPDINASVIALSAGTSRDRSLQDTAAIKAELAGETAAAGAQAGRLAELQRTIDAALVRIDEIKQRVAPLVENALELREEASALVDVAGADWAQNQKRITALKKAESAEVGARAAQQEEAAVGASVTAAASDLTDLQVWVTQVNARIRFLSARLTAYGGKPQMEGNARSIRPVVDSSLRAPENPL